MQHFRTRFQRFIFLRVFYMYADDRSFKKHVFEKWKKRTIFQGDAPSPVINMGDHIVMNKKLASYFRRKLLAHQSDIINQKPIQCKSEPLFIQTFTETLITDRSQSLTDQRITEISEEKTEQQQPQLKYGISVPQKSYSIISGTILLFLLIIILNMLSNKKNLE